MAAFFLLQSTLDLELAATVLGLGGAQGGLVHRQLMLEMAGIEHRQHLATADAVADPDRDLFQLAGGLRRHDHGIARQHHSEITLGSTSRRWKLLGSLRPHRLGLSRRVELRLRAPKTTAAKRPEDASGHQEPKTRENNALTPDDRHPVKLNGSASIREEIQLTKSSPWRPLLDGDQADIAWRAILDVAAALENPPPPPAVDGEVAPSRGAGLASGSAGGALFYTYLAQARDEERYADLAESRLDEAIEALATTTMGPGLYGGFTGVAWTARHLEGRLFESEEEEGEQEIDRVLADLLERGPWPGDYDLIGGLAGFGLYALEGLPNADARRCLERVIEQLAELATNDEQGTAWHTGTHLLPPQQLEICPEGYYNLGVAHGIPAVLAVLAYAVRAGVAAQTADRLLTPAVEWMLAQELDNGDGFPTWLGEGAQRSRARMAWCYGDPGLATTLLLTARIAGNATWEEHAVRVARAAARRPEEQSGIRDVGLCHGSVGLAHLYNRLYQATGEDLFADTARFWYGQTLEMRRPGEGLAGFLAFMPDLEGNMKWEADPGFLTGAAGVALALLAAVTELEPEWDRVLLSSLPPKESARK